MDIAIHLLTWRLLVSPTHNILWILPDKFRADLGSLRYGLEPSRVSALYREDGVESRLQLVVQGVRPFEATAT